jgi:VanZ family protein
MLKVFLSVLFALCVHASDTNATAKETSLSKTQKLLLTNALMSGVIITWGYTQWDYGTQKLHSGSEGWFEKETSNGGSDKLGHFYTNYLMTRVLAPFYEAWGYTKDDAALYSALTSAFQSIMIMEVGDATSPEHGFSNEDFIADLLGSVVGYYWYRYPSLAKKIDFRVEYLPDFNDLQSDFTTDYEHMKHLMAIKAEGFESLENTWAQYFELHVGYYTRNFDHNSVFPIEDRERYMYAGIGINLSNLLRPAIGNYSTVFNYYQVPYTYLSYDEELK